MKLQTSKAFLRRIALAMIVLFSNGSLPSAAEFPSEGAKFVRGTQLIDDNCQAQNGEIFRRKVALVVGIDQYTAAVGPLRLAVADAMAIKNLLEQDLGFDEVSTLVNEQATRAGILREIIRLKEGMQFDDQFLFFFAGHGVAQGRESNQICFLLPQEIPDPFGTAVAVGGLSLWDLRDRLMVLPAKHVLMIIDACFSGCAAVVARGGGESVGDQKALCKLTNSRTRQILTAGGRKEVVREEEGWSQSALTTALIEGLGNRLAPSFVQGDVSIVGASDLFPYVRERVSKITGGNQIPRLFNVGEPKDGDVFFVLPKAGDAKAGKLGQHTRAFVISHDAVLFDSPKDNEGALVPFMTLYFRQHGELDGRVPVSNQVNSSAPVGWISAQNLAVWPDNRVLVAGQEEITVPVWAKKECASSSLPKQGRDSACRPLSFIGNQLATLQGVPLPIPVLRETEDAFQIGVVLSSDLSHSRVQVESSVPLGGFRSGASAFAQVWLSKASLERSGMKIEVMLRERTLKLWANQIQSEAVEAGELMGKSSEALAKGEFLESCERIVSLISTVVSSAVNPITGLCEASSSRRSGRRLAIRQLELIGDRLEELSDTPNRIRRINGEDFVLIPPQAFEPH